jgi:tetratricopeptide (TPR) repeat protein
MAERTEDDDPAFRDTERFVIERRLGSGGMGVVYQAYDREQQAHVALKTLRWHEPRSLVRFKKEFRSLTDLAHPNLVRLQELFCQDEAWFFTMELVVGMDFLTYVRPPHVGAGFDEARLRDALAQLCLGVSHLHAAHLLHRDIKPSNVLVSDAARVVLLDFGLVATLAEGAHEPEPRGVGTVAYMAPEQAASLPVGPPADWYSVGVVLYEALTGTRPFSGTQLEVLTRKASRDPLPPSTVASGVPKDLDALCAELLSRDARQRPAGTDILARLGVSDPAASITAAAPRPTPSPVFVGRRAELAFLEQAFQDCRRKRQAVTVVLSGESGLGKTALVETFAASVAAEPGTQVLHGRCYERESVPYKALDSIIDALSRRLAALEPIDAALLLPRDVGALARLFPVLRQVPAMAHVQPPTIPSPQELRARAFLALRAFLHALCDRDALVLSIDDFQWADADSVTLLVELMRPPDPPPLLLLITRRNAHDHADHANRLPGDVRTLPLGPLLPGDAALLATQLLEAAGHAGRRAETLAREAEGHPLFLYELARYAQDAGPLDPSVPLDEALWHRVCRLESKARHLLELLAVASAPLPQVTAAQAARLPPSEFARVVLLLHTASLIRTTGPRATDLVEPYHDRVREAVLAHLPPETRRLHHGDLAEALRTTGVASRDPQSLVGHLEATGQTARAAEYAERAAELAEGTLAFDQAADLFRTALRLATDDTATSRLLRKLAEALVNAGRSAQAGEAYEQVAEAAEASEALDLRRRAGEHYLRGGHVDRGLGVLRSVLSQLDIHLPETSGQALWALLQVRAKIRLRGTRFSPRAEADLPARSRLRMDACWSAAQGLAIVDLMRGFDFQTRHLLLALKAGDSSRVARSLATEAAVSAGGGLRNRRRTARLIGLADELAEKVQHPHSLGVVRGWTGVARLLEGQWRDALRLVTDAEAIFRERCVGVFWELDTMHAVAVSSLAYLGEIKELTQRVPAYLREAEARGDLYQATQMRTGEASLAWLARGDATGARRESERATRDFARSAALIQDYADLIAKVRIDLYEDEADSAWARIGARWPALAKSLLLHVQVMRVVTWNLRGSAAVAAARKSKHKPKNLLGAALRDARRIQREGAPWARALARLLFAGIAAAQGNSPRAALLFARAIEELTSTEMTLLAEVARWRLADLLGGAVGDSHHQHCLDYATAQGIVNPARLFAMLSP